MSKTNIRTLSDLQNADSDVDVHMSRKDFLLARSTNENTITQLETRLKDCIAKIKAGDIKLTGAEKGFNTMKEKANKANQEAEKANQEIKLLTDQINILKNKKQSGGNVSQPIFKISDDNIKKGAEEIYEKKYKNDVDNYLKQFE
jgi:outer membrane murein-binding lipoprotein Lpp